jgi:hypothetical protein
LLIQARMTKANVMSLTGRALSQFALDSIIPLGYSRMVRLWQLDKITAVSVMYRV